MNEEAQNRALLEWMGEKYHGDEVDLDLLHEAVGKLRPEDANRWAVKLNSIVMFGANPHWNRDFHIANATIAQRREALLKTLGLWREE